jgi:ABC-2 type transport system ATP-binding protein
MLTLNNVNKSFRNGFCLKIGCLTFNPGEIVALIGKNGAGKTTLLRILAALYDHSGVIFHVKDKLSYRSILGYMPEDSGLYNNLSAFENIHFYRSFYSQSIDIELIKKFLDTFEIPVQQNVGSFSKGLKQIVLFIRSIIHDPEIILLDEPFNAVDPDNRIKMKDIIMNLKERKKIIIISSHVLDEIEKIADRIIIIKKGEVIYDELSKNVIKEGISLESIYKGR